MVNVEEEVVKVMLGACGVLAAKIRMSGLLGSVGEQSGPSMPEGSKCDPESPKQVARTEHSNVQDVEVLDVGDPRMQCWRWGEHHSGVSIGSPQHAECEGHGTGEGCPRRIRWSATFRGHPN